MLTAIRYLKVCVRASKCMLLWRARTPSGGYLRARLCRSADRVGSVCSDLGGISKLHGDAGHLGRRWVVLGQCAVIGACASRLSTNSSRTLRRQAAFVTLANAVQTSDPFGHRARAMLQSPLPGAQHKLSVGQFQRLSASLWEAQARAQARAQAHNNLHVVKMS